MIYGNMNYYIKPVVMGVMALWVVGAAGLSQSPIRNSDIDDYNYESELPDIIYGDALAVFDVPQSEPQCSEGFVKASDGTCRPQVASTTSLGGSRVCPPAYISIYGRCLPYGSVQKPVHGSSWGCPPRYRMFYGRCVPAYG